MSRSEREIFELCKVLNLKVEPLLFDDWMVRREAYQLWGYTEKAFDDERWEIRIEAYRKRGFAEKAFDDIDVDIRREAYHVMGFTEKAFDDGSWEIRREAYLRKVFTEEALDDKDPYIRREAEDYFKLKAKCESDKGKSSAKREIELWILEKL